MKKNAISHMQPPKESVGSWFRRWQILPRLLCLILALVIWLTVYHVTNKTDDTPNAGVEVTDTV